MFEKTADSYGDAAGTYKSKKTQKIIKGKRDWQMDDQSRFLLFMYQKLIDKINK